MKDFRIKPLSVFIGVANALTALALMAANLVCVILMIGVALNFLSVQFLDLVLLRWGGQNPVLAAYQLIQLGCISVAIQYASIILDVPRPSSIVRGSFEDKGRP